MCLYHENLVLNYSKINYVHFNTDKWFQKSKPTIQHLETYIYTHNFTPSSSTLFALSCVFSNGHVR